MSRRWLLSLSCLSVFFVLFVQLTRADSELRINEARTRILLAKEPIELLLAVENPSGRIVNAKIQVELLAPDNRIMAQRSLVQAVGIGNQTLSLSLPASFSSFKPEHRRQLLWYRLHYRLNEEGSLAASVSEGILSLSEIAPELFEIGIATAETLREGGRYRARVQTIHPVTRQPAADVRIDGEITLA